MINPRGLELTRNNANSTQLSWSWGRAELGKNLLEMINTSDTNKILKLEKPHKIGSMVTMNINTQDSHLLALTCLAGGVQGCIPPQNQTGSSIVLSAPVQRGNWPSTTRLSLTVNISNIRRGISGFYTGYLNVVDASILQ